MTAPTAARAAALDALRGVRRGLLADHAFDRAARALDARDRAWAQELVYGTVRLRARLDHALAGVSSRPLDRLDADVLDVLRLGAYQLLEMDGVPAYAAVSQAVEQTRATTRSAAGFVNGVLQSLRRRTPVYPAYEDDVVAHLTTWGSHPAWLVERWLGQFGEAATRTLVELNNTRPETWLRRLGPVQATSSRTVRLADGAPGDVLDAEPLIVQDPGAGAVVDFIGAVTGVLVDLAAAPGGKALALAGAGGAAPFVVAADSSARRLARLAENVHRLERAPPQGLGPLPLALLVADARRSPLRAAPTVLLDAPCTGTGTLRRHADGRWRVSPAMLAALVQLQAELLHAAAALVPAGGLLVYATCSLEPEENEQQVQAFLERHADFEVERGAGDAVAADGTLRVLPHVHGADGAFAARLRRRA